MNDLDRIENALAKQRLDADAFERCAQDMLTDLYPGLSPIPGGTDWGRDADIAGTGDTVPPRLLVTSSRTLAGVRKNMLGGISSLKEHAVPASRLVLANPAKLRLLERQKLVASAQRAGMYLDASDIFDGGFFASRLRRDGHWRSRLLGLPSGPISLSRVAADLAENPWAFLPLVARDDDLTAICGNEDLVLSGPPGVGKSRLASELLEAVFVDKDASFEQIASDLRWTLPSAIVVDDAADHPQLVRRLLTLRQTEPDLFAFRLVVICWPDDIDALCAVLPAARTHILELMERAPMDELLQLMGLTGGLARGEILDQAEGRPGWAVTLADLLLRAGDVQSLLNGQALLGQVDRYLRRAGVGAEAMDVLATVAALGGVSEDEIARLAKEVEVTRAVTAAALGTSAKSGLIDVRSSRRADDNHRTLRLYRVRPPMLASVLGTERAFAASVPTVDFDGLANRWPDHVGSLAGAAIDAVLLGAANARSRAEALMDEALTSDGVSVETRVNLLTRFLRVDKLAAERVMNLARESFDNSVASGASGRMFEPVVALAALVARWYRADDAFELLLDACLVDERTTNPHPGHPLRTLADLVHDFHPEVARQEDIRYKIAVATERWLAVDRSSPERRRVATSVMSAALSLNLRSAHADPGRPMTLQLIETVLAPAEMRRLSRKLWPVVERMLNDDNGDLADAMVDVAGNWLRIGGGYDRPFGRGHGSDSIAAAKEIGQALVQELTARTDLGLGTRVRLRSAAERHNLSIAVDIPNDVEAFFREIERREEDWQEAERDLIADLKSTAESWASEPPTVVINRLVLLRAELQRANLRWPDRTWIACSTLAEKVDRPLLWLQACQAAGFMPEGSRFAERALVKGDLAKEQVADLLADAHTRPQMLGAMLVSTSERTWVAEYAVQSLTSHDYRLLETLILRNELTPLRIQQLLDGTTGLVRATVAVSLVLGRRHDGDWTPGEFESRWLDALMDLRPAALPEVPHYEMSALFQYLAQRYPATLAAIVEGSLAEASSSEIYGALPHDCWDVLDQLPPEQKLKLWRRFHDEPVTKWLLNDHLVGSDVEWLAQMLDEGDMSVDDALGAFRGLGVEPPVAALAKLLVPRGVDPDRIAGLRFSGSWSGEQSDRYQSIMDSFEAMAADTDPHVLAVSAAGVRIFTAARDDAAHRERQQRIRGER